MSAPNGKDNNMIAYTVTIKAPGAGCAQISDLPLLNGPFYDAAAR